MKRRVSLSLVLAVAAALVSSLLARPSPARAAPARPSSAPDVTILTPPPVPPPPPASPVIHAPPDLSPFLGQPLAAATVVLDDTRWPDVRVPVLSVMRPGDRITPSLVRRAIDEVLSTGHFADAHVVFTAEPSGVRATVHVMPRKVIDSVQLTLNKAPLDGDELLRDAGLIADAELVGRELPAKRALIEAMVRRRGFPSPRVTISTRGTDDPLRVVAVVEINAGPPRRIERRVVYPFGGTASERADAESSYVAKVGDRADEAALSAADAMLAARIRSRGHYHATVTHDVVLHHGLIVLRVRVDFGTRYETRYLGNDHFDKSALDGVLDLETETDRTPNHLLGKLQEFYVKHGFLDASVSLEERGTARDPVNYWVFHVRERARVVVAGRSYPCLRETETKRLDKAPGDASEIGDEIDSFLEEELPGADLFVPPRPAGVDATLGGAPGESSPAPLDLEPVSVYAPETYERAVQHVQELYRAEGFLSAQVGPVQVRRRTCDPRSPPGECRPLRAPPPPDVCTYDATGLPLPVAPLQPGSTCEPDPAKGIECEARVWLRIPVKLGPRTQLYDVLFSGAKAISPAKLAEAADLKLGSYVSTVAIEEARGRVADAYKEEGYAFVEVKYVLETSPDRTRARVRFSVAEGPRVMVRQIVVRGNVFTKTGVIERRIALEVGQPYRASDVRKTEERIATLGVFASVTVGLENPYVPQQNKVVLVSVVERPRQYMEVAPGFSTGQGFRLTAEYGNRNLWGNAVQLRAGLQLAFIPTPLIIDPVSRDNYRDLNLLARIGVRATGSLVFPEIGLGPLVRTGIDGIVVHTLRRDFYLTKIAAIPNINYRPVSELQLSYFQGVELNNSRIFQQGTIADYLTSLAQQGQNTTSLVRQLLVPDGETYVVSERLLVSWDRRDNPFNASRGTYLVSGVEHVDGYPVLDKSIAVAGQTKTSPESHFFKLTETFGGYIPLPKGWRIAALTRMGVNVQITPTSETYPDRLFFMGGVNSMRGWLLYSFIPQDYVDRIAADANKPDFVPDATQPGSPLVPNPNKFTPGTRPIRGGNLMLNQRIELRIPIRGPFETVVFGDIGNLWIDPQYPLSHGIPMRVALGSGLRVQTPVGPLAVDYGINVTRKPYEDFGAINFAIGLY